MSELAIYINSHDLQDNRLNKEIAEIPIGKCLVFFNSDIWSDWPHPTIHSKNLPSFKGQILATCPQTWKYTKYLMPNLKNHLFLWRPNLSHKYRAIETIKATIEATSLSWIDTNILPVYTKINHLKELI